MISTQFSLLTLLEEPELTRLATGGSGAGLEEKGDQKFGCLRRQAGSGGLSETREKGENPGAARYTQQRQGIGHPAQDQRRWHARFSVAD